MLDLDYLRPQQAILTGVAVSIVQLSLPFRRYRHSDHGVSRQRRPPNTCEVDKIHSTHGVFEDREIECSDIL